MANAPIGIVLLGYNDVQTLDLSGPLDAFAAANESRPGAYKVRVASLDGAPFTSEAGLKITPDCALDDAGPIDTLMIPGGAGLRDPETNRSISAALQRIAPTVRRTVSICTGIYGTAAAGLLDGRRATTHWRFAADVARQFPKIRLDSNAIYIKDGSFYSSAGITAAIDLALALIEEDFGAALSLYVARDLVVYLKRAGGQRQYSAPLRFQIRAGDRFALLAGWMADHLAEDLSVNILADQAEISPRQFTRRFKQVFGVSPAHQVELLRLDAAREHLIGSKAPIGMIAGLVGFRSDDAFRRAFDRRFGVPPGDYRQRFAPIQDFAQR